MKCFDFGRVNDAQKEAVLTTEGSVLMIAGPGTGKTFTLVKRIAYLVIEKSVKPSEIMIVTFTEKAGRELLTRVSDEFIKYVLELNLNEMYIGTFHAVCLRLLKENAADNARQGRMMDAFEQTYFVCRNISSFQSLTDYEKYITPKGYWKQAAEICRYVNQLMEELVNIDAMEQDADPDMVFLAKLTKRYKELLHRHGLMDFSSIQTQTYEMLKEHPDILSRLQKNIRYIMVDEYQDTNYIQEQLVFMIAGERQNICVVGDDDQGMYRFRGATIRNILEFPSKFPQGACRKIHLEINYRSEPGIIDFYNRWMTNVEGLNLFNWNRYRYDKTIEAGKPPLLPERSVYSCGGDSLDEEKEELLDMVIRLIKNGNITNYNQVAFLFRSVKSEEATAIGEYFEANGIPVYSPRSNMFFERMEVKQILGCLMMCFQSYLVSLKSGDFRRPISKSLREYYITCLKAALPLAKADAKLMAAIESAKKMIVELKKDSDTTLLDIFYRLIAFEPFRTYLSAKLNDNISKTRAARNLSEISRMISKYAFLHDMHQLTVRNKYTMPEEFFNVYLKYMIEDGVGEYEDASEYAPDGCVSFMTIHQSKGLEFPVVVVGSLGNVPRRNSDPLMYSAESRFFHRRPFEPMSDIKYFDFWRLYYTAFSRAQNLLVLSRKKADSKYFGEYLDTLPDVSEFTERVQFADVKSVNNKNTYSFTSHIAVYDDCPKQYMFIKEYGFAKNYQVHSSVGTLVHATLEDMNNCIIEGKEQRLSEELLKQWFTKHYEEMYDETGFSLTEEEREEVFSQVSRYYHSRRNDLHFAWKAEEEIELVLPEFIMQGVVDLIEDHGETLEIIDYKTGPKPDIIMNPEKIAHYKSQLEVYAYLVGKRFGKRVNRMSLYYTNCKDGDPFIKFEWSRESIEKAVRDITEIIRKIEAKSFDGDVKNTYTCAYCEMRHLCGKG